MKWKNVFPKIWNYLRYDFREIVWPSSLPDPPSVAAQKVTLKFKDHREVWYSATKEYLQTWSRNVAKPKSGPIEQTVERKTKLDNEPATFMEDFAASARYGAEGMKPFLQRLYMTRLSHYKDALSQFVDGYKEGLKEAVKDSESWKQEDSELSAKPESETSNPSKP